jgi:serine/threonine-protein kinase HipA
MLKEIGGECAGAVTLLDQETQPSTQQRSYHRISQKELEQILETLPQKPLLAGEAEVRLSLAGAQNKLAIFQDSNGFALPLHESPSSHIIKPEPVSFPGLVENEAYCLHLAQAVGLPTAQAKPMVFGKHRCLLLTRYDRQWENENLSRRHQEDFCQALGTPSQLKYQAEGGPHITHCFELIRQVSSQPAKDLITLFESVLFNVLIGNNDAHAKNFSLLYVPSKSSVRIQLTPLYDLVCTEAYPNLSQKMAMKIGEKSLSADLRRRHWELYWNAIGFSPKQALKQTNQFMEKTNQILHKAPNNVVEENIQRIMKDHLIRLHKTLKT